MTPSIVEVDRSTFWLRGWLAYYGQAELEAMVKNKPNTDIEPTRPRNVEEEVAVCVWPWHNIHDPIMINRRAELMLEALVKDWVVFFSDPFSWDEVMVMRACASYAPMWVTRYQRQGDPAMENAGLQFPIASRVKIPGRGCHQKLIVISDSLWAEVTRWTTPPTADNDYQIDMLPGYRQHDRPRAAAAYKSALQSAAIKMFDRCAAVDGFYLAAMFSAGWAVKVLMNEEAHNQYVERMRTIEGRPTQPKRGGRPAGSGRRRKVQSEGPTTTQQRAGSAASTFEEGEAVRVEGVTTGLPTVEEEGDIRKQTTTEDTDTGTGEVITQSDGNTGFDLPSYAIP
ncbi:hypothetical protein Tcan_02788 [Toxocara canis]|uniref:Uncharacterized protein n=2 Tax=Toxocara canis TaxID=6265 RepID=A0A0B2VA99_TOXCA|nr:hypothetical protein Tcan_02788 [Toxocara canis]VDM37762.1 unnamed protein product [Toxocara canis]